MKTAYYTFTTWNSDGMAAGFGGAVSGPRQAAMVRQPGPGQSRGGGKVVDLTAWRTENLDGPSDEPMDELTWAAESCGELDEADPAVPVPRPRRSRRAVLTAELISTLSVVAVAAAIILRVLTF